MVSSGRIGDHSQEDGDPTERLRQLFSGVPPSRRDARPIVMLQVFIDDSKTGEEVLVLGGYIGLWQRWAEFSIAWQKLLDEARWDEFKMSRAANQPERAQRFSAVMEQHVAAYVACVLEIGALRQLCHELALPKFCANPYNFAIKAILGATYMELGRVGLRWPMEFIFDERGEKVHLRAGWDFFVLGMPSEVRSLIAREPKFENSKDVLPLQAAEIIVWHAREHWLKHRKFEGEIELLWPQAKPVKGHLVHWDYDALKPNMESLRALLLSWGYPLPAIPDELEERRRRSDEGG